MAPVPTPATQPKSLDEYLQWLRRDRSVTETALTATYYDAVTLRMKSAFEASEVWKAIVGELREWHDEYGLGGYPLLTGFSPELVIKPHQSFLLKTMRKNCGRNANWPDPPDDGWLLPDNWYSRIHDLVRTYVVVKYLDGVEFMLEKMGSFLTSRSIAHEGSLEARTEGYYAGHIEIMQEFEIPRETWDSTRIITGIELQITTQLQEVMRTHLHEYYDVRRLAAAPDPVAWQWNYRTPEFATGYLGHILHYVEGMIVELRDRKKGTSA
jgi:hypothetical protein